MQSKKIYVAKCATILSVVPLLIFAHSTGPEPRKTGAPGDTTCSQAGCHLGTVNQNGEKIEVTFEGGSNYVPGQKQRITIRITEPRNGARGIYGFQMTARLGSNEATGQAGRFTAVDPQTVVLCNDGRERDLAPLNGNCRDGQTVEFIEHSSPKQTGEFFVDWTPPTSDAGNIRFYVASNVANGNGMETGDRIYTSNFTLTPGTGGGGGSRPAIRSDGVVNGASFTAGIQAGSWVTIFGSNLAPTTRIWNDKTEIVDGRLPTELDGVKVNIAGKPAAVYFISPGQINVQAPDDIGTGNVAVEVVNANGTSATVTGASQTAAPAFFLFDPENRRYPAAVHTDGTFLGKAGLFQGLTTKPAKPGDVILLFGTAFGPTDPPVQSGRIFSGAARLVATPVIRIGNVPAQVQFAGLSGAGLYQFNVVVPDVGNGDQGVVAEVSGGLSTQQNVFITIQR
jgi:uncharacterized protein (TIGR03437 family)